MADADALSDFRDGLEKIIREEVSKIGAGDFGARLAAGRAADRIATAVKTTPAEAQKIAFTLSWAASQAGDLRLRNSHLEVFQPRGLLSIVDEPGGDRVVKWLRPN